MKSSTWYVEGDIKSYLLTINHEKLMGANRKKGEGQKTNRFNTIGTKSQDFHHRGKRDHTRTRDPSGRNTQSITIECISS